MKFNFEKTIVVRTRVQSATATLHFTAVLQYVIFAAFRFSRFLQGMPQKANFWLKTGPRGLNQRFCKENSIGELSQRKLEKCVLFEPRHGEICRFTGENARGPTDYVVLLRKMPGARPNM